ncbi:MAG TPA: histidinol-phosphate transaminase [Gemmatimonadales bacterium]|nr:histidinol-phosphate transaminase [Gemmatimonadales bacterium]
MSRPPTPATPPTPVPPIALESTGPGGAVPDGAEGLALIKSGVRAQAGYTLRAPAARRKLNQNECPHDLPPELKRAVLDRAAAAAWQRYPEFVPARLVERLAEHYGWVPDGVVVGNGSNELIQATLSVVLAEGDAVVAPAPTFSLYRLLTGVLGGRFVPVPLGPRFEFELDRIVETAVRERARVVVLNSPNNPTGSALPEGAVERLLAETGALIVCDEAYQDFGGPTAIPLLRRSSRLVVLRTFSKAMGMAGLRFGLGLAHPEVARELSKGKLPYNVNLVTLAAADVALDHAAFFAGRTRSVAATRDRLVPRMARLTGIEVYPTAANFVLIRCRARPASEVFRRLYDEHGILVRDVSNSAELAECLRITIGTEDDMEAVLAALEAILASEAEAR